MEEFEESRDSENKSKQNLIWSTIKSMKGQRQKGRVKSLEKVREERNEEKNKEREREGNED